MPRRKKKSTKPTTAETSLIARPLTQGQKNLLQKSVTLRFNGMIRAINEGVSEQEEIHQNLPSVHREWEAYVSGPRLQSLPRRDYPPAIREVLDEMIREEQQLQKEMARVISLLKKRTETFVRMVREENDRRTEICEKAREARRSVIQELRQTRDTAIEDIAFHGQEDAREYAHSVVPDPADVLRKLARLGAKSTFELPVTTGVGDRNPPDLIDRAD